jgi:dTDP-4-amino-4,6-dideoxygalactose transaminase
MENKYKINWSGRSVDYSKEEIDTVVNTMKTADPLTQGKYLKEFEQKFSEYLGVKNCFAVSSCTAALELAAILSGLKKGDEVIIPAHTFCATAIPFARTGVKIIWADIDEGTRVVSAKTIEKLITKKTKAIVVVHLYGLMANMPEIMDLAQKNNILVIEDCAQAIGAELKNKKAGSFGDFSCFSFHCQKSLNTLGEGGMLVVKNERSAKMVPGLRHNGVRSFEGERECFWKPAMANVDFDIDNFWPYNFCIGEVQCALGAEMLKTIDKQNAERRQRAKKFIEALKDFPELSFQKVKEDKSHVWHLLSAKYSGKKYGKNKDDLISLLNEKYLIKAIVQYYPLYRYPIFKKAGFGEANCPNTDDFFDNMISFPFHLWMSKKDLNYMMNSTKKALEELRK